MYPQPICSVFAGLPADIIADRLRKLFGDHTQLPADIARTPDPFEVFTYAASVSSDLAARVEAEMTDQELAAVATAAPTPYVHDVVTACQNSGRSVSIVSNNSARAVHAYLARHGLDDRISLVVARTSHDPALLKPSPHLITQAVAALDAEPGECTLLGDSVTDVQGARLASVQSIGYANKPGKRERLSEAGAGATINSLADLALKFRARAADPELLQLSLLTTFKGAYGASRRTAWVRCRLQTADNRRSRSARHPTVTGPGGGHFAVTGRQRYRALSGGSPAGAAAAAGPLARTPPRPVPCRRPVATLQELAGRLPRAGHPVAEQRSPSRGAPAARRCALAQAPPLEQ